MKKTIPTLVLLLLGILMIAFLTQSSEVNEKPAADTFKNTVRTFPVPHPVSMDFAGEIVPLQLFDVRERLDRELNINTYFQSQTLFYLKRASRWFPVIEPILKKNGVP